MDKDHVSAFASGEPNTAYPQYFTGQSYLKMLTKGKIPVAMEHMGIVGPCALAWCMGWH